MSLNSIELGQAIWVSNQINPFNDYTNGSEMFIVQNVTVEEKESTVHSYVTKIKAKRKTKSLAEQSIFLAEADFNKYWFLENPLTWNAKE